MKLRFCWCTYVGVTVSDCVQPILQCRLERAFNMNLEGTVEGKGEGGEEERVQFNANQGQEWTSFAPQCKEGISK